MVKQSEETKIVTRYGQDYDGGKVIAEVTSFKKKGSAIYIDLGDSDGLPFGSFSTMGRSKAVALAALLDEVLKDHPE